MESFRRRDLSSDVQILLPIQLAIPYVLKAKAALWLPKWRRLPNQRWEESR